MPKHSAGVLIYRITDGRLDVLLVHPGGPFWARKDAGAWTIPKGEIEPGETADARARIEFREETGIDLAGIALAPLGEVRQKGGKVVTAFAAAMDIDAAACRSNTFHMEWPPRSGRVAAFPEIDRAAWFDTAAARIKINPAQAELLDRLKALVKC